MGALIPTETVGSRHTGLLEVPVAAIRPNPLQPRSHFDEEAMSSLAASIREIGVLQPVLVRAIGPDEYELIAGERRWRAARRAGRQTIPVIVQDVSDSQSLEQALVENLHRHDLGPLEEASAYHQLIEDFGYTHDQVARRVGRSRTAVTNTLRLLQLPPGVQRALADGQITAGHGRALLGTPDRSFQEELCARTVAEDLPVRAVEEIVRRRAEEVTGRSEEVAPPSVDTVPPEEMETDSGRDHPPAHPLQPRRLPEAGILELEDMLSTHLNTRVKVALTGRRGRVVIDFATVEDLERIYKLMVRA